MGMGSQFGGRSFSLSRPPEKFRKDTGMDRALDEIWDSHGDNRLRDAAAEAKAFNAWADDDTPEAAK